MQIAVSMWSFHRTIEHQAWAVLDFLKFCHGNGITQVELLDIFWLNRERELPQVQNFLQSSGISVCAYGITNDFSSDRPEERKQALNKVIIGMETAAFLDAPVVRIFAGDLKPELPREKSERFIQEGLLAATEAAERKGIKLALENHGFLAGSSKMIHDLVTRIGSTHLAITFDAGNFLLVGEPPLQALELLLPNVIHVHVKDFQKRTSQLRDTDNPAEITGYNGEKFLPVVCGTGEVPLSEVLTVLRREGYRGSVSIEYEGEGNEAAGVLKSIIYIQSVLEQTTNI